MDPSLSRRQRDRALARERLRLYTKRIAFWSGGLAVLLSVVAAQTLPGHSSPGAASSGQAASNSNQADPQNASQQQVNQGDPFGGGGGFFGSGGGGAVAVTGGS